MEDVRGLVRAFLLDNFLPGEPPEALIDNVDLQESGVMDSLAMLKLVSYLEERFQIDFLPDDLAAEQFASVEGIEAIVRAKVETES